jgi:hypothetical protein
MAKTKKKSEVLTVETEQSIDMEDIRGLLCTALEGSMSKCWYMIEGYVYPRGLKSKDYNEGGKGQTGKEYWHPAEIVPTQEGGSVIFSSTEDEVLNGKSQWVLDLPAIKRGLALMAEKYPRHFGDFRAEKSDSITGDVFLQCCLFEDVIYG